MTQSNETALIVIHPFGAYAKGAIIIDPSAIAAIRAAGRAGSVIQTVVPSASPATKGAN